MTIERKIALYTELKSFLIIKHEAKGLSGLTVLNSTLKKNENDLTEHEGLDLAINTICGFINNPDLLPNINHN